LHDIWHFYNEGTQISHNNFSGLIIFDDVGKKCVFFEY